MSRPPITRARPYTPQRGLVAGQTFTSERQYRNALARARGFVSHYQRVRQPHIITSAREAQALRPAAREARRRAFQVLAEARRTGEPIRKVAKDYRISLESVKRYVAPALTKDERGRWVARPSDRLYRQLTTITTEGVVKVDTRSSKTASLIARYNNAVRRFLSTNNPDHLKPFRGKTFQVAKRRFRFETDPDKLKKLEESGQLDEADWGSP
uniref:Hypothetical conserved protein n=1 Tax=uncultured prokaryote TaxID=198431 RepID=H5SCL8_9ZZZZ|nr:hypothetical conserved protein [uncultured prokaryote]